MGDHYGNSDPVNAEKNPWPIKTFRVYKLWSTLSRENSLPKFLSLWDAATMLEIGAEIKIK